MTSHIEQFQENLLKESMYSSNIEEVWPVNSRIFSLNMLCYNILFGTTDHIVGMFTDFPLLTYYKKKYSEEYDIQLTSREVTADIVISNIKRSVVSTMLNKIYCPPTRQRSTPLNRVVFCFADSYTFEVKIVQIIYNVFESPHMMIALNRFDNSIYRHNLNIGICGNVIKPIRTIVYGNNPTIINHNIRTTIHRRYIKETFV